MDTTNRGVSVADRLEAYLSPSESPTSKQEINKSQDIQEAVQDIEVTDVSLDDADTDQSEVEANDSQGANDESESLSLSDLAQYLGIDESKLDVSDDGLIVKTKIDGEEGRAKFADLIKSYQLEGHLNKQNIAVSEKQKALEARQAEIERLAGEKLNRLEDLSRMAYNKLLSDYNAINWQELRQDDPAEYAARQNDFQRAQNEINQAFNQVQYERQQQAVKQQESYQNYLSREAGKLVEMIPSWSNSEIAQKEKSDIAAYAKSDLGFSADEISNIGDSRIVNMMRKAMLYDKLQSTKPTIEKKVKSAPKLVKAGQSSNSGDRNIADMNKVKAEIVKSGGKKGVTDYLMKKGII